MKVVIAGAGGRMGRTLIEAVLANASFTLAAALDVPESPAIGTVVGVVSVGSDIAAAVSAADVLIDFTRPEGTLAHVDACVAAGKAMVIGTTGFTSEQLLRISDAARQIPIVMSPNFAVGVNVVFRLAETAAKILGDDYDVEIIEAHHRHKVDAPSGTALELGKLIAKALDRNLGDVATHGRQGEPGARPAKEIGFHAIRGGDIVGEHTIVFAGTGERVEVTVRSQSRLTYANGALRAVKFLRGRKNGLYDMQDVLTLR
ncbi:MAG TPA: 4-hydroxy-tetrahydrodipicolinate reductase [Burkholderiales bacterium]|nr:4-hydroxy-tetrahydrodipicolinate reductase [Burkholderiales bacterium]